jgi:Holliday junction resolvase|tara:strand:+ start:209 stop:481 length:273 start_codon:yes stop_codon:yes gene_type:complete
MLESAIESAVCKYAKNKGWLVYKFVSPNNRGVPDRIMLRNGVILFIEFKATGKQPTTLQQYIIKRIRGEKFKVYVIDSVEIGKKTLDSYD